MRLKRKKEYRTEHLRVRCKEEIKNELQRKANIYTEGNLSEYILFAALNFVPKKSDLVK